jgi:hypothetical protein
LTDSYNNVLSKPIHKRAKGQLHKYVIDFAFDLVIESKLVSSRNDDEEVLKSHVDQAYENLTRTPSQSWAVHLMIIFGSALFGAFVPGFVVELTKVFPNPLVVGVYTVLGFFGLLLVFGGLRRQ